MLYGSSDVFCFGTLTQPGSSPLSLTTSWMRRCSVRCWRFTVASSKRNFVSIATQCTSRYGVRISDRFSFADPAAQGLDVFSQPIKPPTAFVSFMCIHCDRQVTTTRYAAHLEKCMGMGRNSSRVARNRILTLNGQSERRYRRHRCIWKVTCSI